jgi:nitroreductase
MLKAILNRRSVREYQTEPVKRELIEEIIEAGQLAPTARNNRQVEFLVIENREIKNKLAYILNKEHVQEFLKQASVLILPVSSWENERLALLDLAIASENMMLQTTELELGSVFKYIDPKYCLEIKELLKIPDNFIFTNLIALGYPSVKPAAHSETEFEPQKIHFDKW